MELVQPIRNKEVINKFKNELLKNGYRDYMLFVIGINTGLRISDILKLQVEDVKDKTHIVIREQKTSKRTRVLINSMLREDIEKYIEGMDNTEYLFKSRKGQISL